MRIAILSVILLFAAVNLSHGETFTATLLPQPNTGSTGTGMATLTLSDDETELSYSITVDGLSGPELAAHIHRPDGTIAHALPLGSPKVGVWQGMGLVDVFFLKGEQLFILVHTEPNPGGELRGDITASQVPIENRTWGAIKAAFETTVP